MMGLWLFLATFILVVTGLWSSFSNFFLGYDMVVVPAYLVAVVGYNGVVVVL